MSEVCLLLSFLLSVYLRRPKWGVSARPCHMCVIWPLQNDIAKWAQAANWLVLCTHYGWHLGALV